jgi:Txe/YoeB family toxin of Txe-Axe toxin-antitoxin module
MKRKKRSDGTINSVELSPMQRVRTMNIQIKNIIRHPEEGIGKPEPLRFQLQRFRSRRIDREH